VTTGNRFPRVGGKTWRPKLEARAGGTSWRPKLEAKAGGQRWRPKLKEKAGGQIWRPKLGDENGGQSWRPKLVTMFAIPRETGISKGRGNRLDMAGATAEACSAHLALRYTVRTL